MGKRACLCACVYVYMCVCGGGAGRGRVARGWFYAFRNSGENFVPVCHRQGRNYQRIQKSMTAAAFPGPHGVISPPPPPPSPRTRIPLPTDRPAGRSLGALLTRVAYALHACHRHLQGGCVFCARWSGTGQQIAWGHSPTHFSVDFQQPTWRKLWLLSRFMSLPRCLAEGSLGPSAIFR